MGHAQPLREAFLDLIDAWVPPVAEEGTDNPTESDRWPVPGDYGRVRPCAS
jgi:hypothetical protein